MTTVEARVQAARTSAASWQPAPCPPRVLQRRPSPPGEPYLLPRVSTMLDPAFEAHRAAQLWIIEDPT